MKPWLTTRTVHGGTPITHCSMTYWVLTVWYSEISCKWIFQHLRTYYLALRLVSSSKTPCWEDVSLSLDMEISRKQKGNKKQVQIGTSRWVVLKFYFFSPNYFCSLYVQCTCTRGAAIHRQLLSDWLESKKPDRDPGQNKHLHSDRNPGGEWYAGVKCNRPHSQESRPAGIPLSVAAA